MIHQWSVRSFKAGERASSQNSRKHRNNKVLYLHLVWNFSASAAHLFSPSKQNGCHHLQQVLVNRRNVLGSASDLIIFRQQSKEMNLVGRRNILPLGNMYWTSLLKRDKIDGLLFSQETQVAWGITKSRLWYFFPEASGIPDLQGPFEASRAFHITVIKNVNWMSSMMPSEFLQHSCIPSSQLPVIMSPLIYRLFEILLHKATVLAGWT